MDGSPGLTVSDALDSDVEIEKDLPIVIVPHQAPDPDARGEAYTPHDSGSAWCRLDAW
jgi:hypothetical protein